VARATADGRVQRGQRTRAAIVDALLSLLERGEGQPTAREVAETAGVSLRSVFQHFADMESLYASCVERQFARLEELRAPVDPEGPFVRRAQHFVAQRAHLYERIAPVRRAALTLAPNSPVIRNGLASATTEHRNAVAVTFAPELDHGDRRERLAAVEMTTCFDAWDHLRRVQRLSVAASERVVVRLVRGVLEGDG
jgi:AcrR family transcriptional regulator